MPVSLPTWPWPARMTPRLVSARNEMSAAFGGNVQRFNRMGSRHAIDVVMPLMPYEEAQDWSAIDAEDDTVVMNIPQPGLDTGAPGVPLVAGAGQTGTTLNLDGLTPYYVLRRRQWLSIITGGTRYAYRVKTEVAANGSGVVAVVLTTMLRTSPADNDVVEIGEPKIEGFATVPEGAWETDTGGLVGLSFTITERR